MDARRPRGRRIVALLLWAWLGAASTAASTAAALEIDPAPVS